MPIEGGRLHSQPLAGCTPSPWQAALPALGSCLGLCRTSCVAGDCGGDGLASAGHEVAEDEAPPRPVAVGTLTTGRRMPDSDNAARTSGCGDPGAPEVNAEAAGRGDDGEACARACSGIDAAMGGPSVCMGYQGTIRNVDKRIADHASRSGSGP